MVLEPRPAGAQWRGFCRREKAYPELLKGFKGASYEPANMAKGANNALKNLEKGANNSSKNLEKGVNNASKNLQNGASYG